MKKLTRVLLAGTATALLAVGGAATAYAAHYQDLALPGSSVAGVSVAGHTRAEVAKSIAGQVAAAKVTVTTPSGTTASSLADLGWKVDVDKTVERVFDQNSHLTSYAKALVTPRAIEPVVSFESATMEKYVAALVAKDGTPAADATVTRAEGATTFTVTPAVVGKTVDPASFQDVVKKAAQQLKPAAATAKIVELPAKVSTEAAQAIADKANAIVAAPVSITSDSASFEPSAEDKASWVTIPVTDGAPAAPTLDATKVAEWVTSRAGELKVDLVKGVRNVSSTGTVLSVSVKARDGVDVSNADQVAKDLVASLGAGKAFTTAFATTVTPATWTERRVAAGAENLAYPAAEGEKWVDVNLSSHTMTAYEGGRAVIGPVAMVNGASATPTVTGTYKIYMKYQSQTMRGENADGTNYEAKDVPWVSYFYRGYALHGAPWRSSFGYTGSHGCVNLPVDVAQQVFSWAPIGTTVVSHN